ncbi:MAG: hypothetical protein EAZ97_07055 [Bacteroidetes bacterium]|nr:MAG: hypothetical protein EAZ97_07055 [Bacteroidota bacterium]
MAKFKDTASFINTLNIIYYAMFCGHIIFFFFVYLNKEKEAFFDFQNEDIFSYVVPLVCVAEVAMAYFLFPIRLKDAIKQETLSKKMEGFLSASLIKWAILEGGALFSVAVFFITANKMYAAWYGFMALVFVLNRNDARHLVSLLKLNKTEEKIVRENLPLE